MSVFNYFCLNPQYSTTRMVTKERPEIRNNSSSKVQTQLFLPPHLQHGGRGGLRIKGYFKKSFETKPLISIITVVYNGVKHLEKTIQSVTGQNYDNVEYIIVDGGSNDGTLDIIKKYEEVIDYWMSEPDKGISDAFNKGIETATGDWLNFLNAGDCFISKETVSNVAKYFKQKHIITGFSKSGKGKCPRRPKNNLQPLQIKARISHQASFISKSIFLKKGNFSTDFRIRMDYDLWMRVLKEYDFLFIDDILVCFDATGISGSDRKLFYQEELFINTRHLRKHVLINLAVLMKYYIEKLLGRGIIVKLLELVR